MLGGQKTFIFELRDREDTGGLLYYEDRSTGANSETSTYQIPRGFTTCACAIFMGQRSNNKNEPCGEWVLSQWLTEQKGQEGETSERKSGGVQWTMGRSLRGVRSRVHRVVLEQIRV